MEELDFNVLLWFYYKEEIVRFQHFSSNKNDDIFHIIGQMKGTIVMAYFRLCICKDLVICNCYKYHRSILPNVLGKFLYINRGK